MVGFSFCINRSFVNYSWHPITVPRSRVDYGAVEREMIGISSGLARFPDGSVVPCQIVCGLAGFGQYYQIRTLQPSGWARFRAHLGDIVDVTVTREGTRLSIDVRSLI